MKNTILKNFMKYVSLNVLGMLGLSCYILADTFFISKGLGTNGLAALNFSISIYCVINGLGLMIGIGGATRYSILKSQNENQRANSTFTHAILFGMLISFILLIVGLFLTAPLSRILGANDTAFPLTNIYLKTILCFSPFFILNNILLAFVRNDGNPKLSMMAMLIGSFFNILLDYVFMFSLSMGMLGAAFATGLAPVISLSLLTLHFIKHNNNFGIIKIKIKVKHFIDIAVLGLSAFITEISSGIVLFVFNLVIFYLAGNVGVASYGIIANLSLVITAIFVGISQGIQPLASIGHGTGDRLLLSKTLRYAITLSIAVSITVYIAIFLCSDWIISIFNSENNLDIIPIATNGFRIYFLGFLFAGLNIIVTAFLSATEKPKNAFIISTTRGCLAIIPLVFILTLIFSIDGVWLSFVFAEIITAIISILYLAKNRPYKRWQLN